MGRAWKLLPIGWLWGALAPAGLVPLPAALGAEDDSEVATVVTEEEEFTPPPRVRPQAPWQVNADQVLGIDDGGRSERRWSRQLAEICREFGLTAEDRDRLDLAAAVDNRRFFDEVDVLRGRLAALARGEDDAREVKNQIFDLRRRFNGGLHGEQSLVIKALRRILAESGSRPPAEPVSDAMRAKYRAAVTAYLARLGEELKLTREQQAALVELVLQETRPASFEGDYQTSQILAQLARVPAEKLNRLIDDSQRDQLNHRLSPYRLLVPGRSEDTQQAIGRVTARLRREAISNSE